MPHMQLRQTYFMLGKVYIFKLKVAQAVESFRLAEEITQRAADGEEYLLYIANCERMINEAYLKSYSQRNKSALTDAK